MKLLITGSSGLIGGEAVEYFDSKGHTVYGMDNNMRKEFFGEAGDTLPNMYRINANAKRFFHLPIDIRDLESVRNAFVYQGPFDAIIHCAAQPSHDKAKDIPIIDFEVNALGTLNLLQMTREYCSYAPFIFMSTNKVYGDAPNEVPMNELETRYDYSRGFLDDITENCRVDQSTHSVFGASKLAADIMTQEYGRYFGMSTYVFRGGCLTGANHSGVELHGFLSYLVKTVVRGGHYKIFGYKGKQVRDNIHSSDVISAMEEVIKNPRQGGNVYNIGGGRENSISILEAIAKLELITGRTLSCQYIPESRVGDHICYITNLTKFQLHHPNWKITKNLDQILRAMVLAESNKFIEDTFKPKEPDVQESDSDNDLPEIPDQA